MRSPEWRDEPRPGPEWSGDGDHQGRRARSGCVGGHRFARVQRQRARERGDAPPGARRGRAAPLLAQRRRAQPDHESHPLDRGPAAGPARRVLFRGHSRDRPRRAAGGAARAARELPLGHRRAGDDPAHDARAHRRTDHHGPRRGLGACDPRHRVGLPGRAPGPGERGARLRYRGDRELRRRLRRGAPSRAPGTPPDRGAHRAGAQHRRPAAARGLPRGDARGRRDGDALARGRGGLYGAVGLSGRAGTPRALAAAHRGVRGERRHGGGRPGRAARRRRARAEGHGRGGLRRHRDRPAPHAAPHNCARGRLPNGRARPSPAPAA